MHYGSDDNEAALGPYLFPTPFPLFYTFSFFFPLSCLSSSHGFYSFSLPFWGVHRDFFEGFLIKTLLPLLAAGRPYSFSAWIPAQSQLLPMEPISPGPSSSVPDSMADPFLCSPSALKPRAPVNPGKMTCAQLMASSKGNFRLLGEFIPECVQCAHDCVCSVWLCVCTGADACQPLSTLFYFIFPLAFNQHLSQLKCKGRADKEIRGSLPKHQ